MVKRDGPPGASASPPSPAGRALSPVAVALRLIQGAAFGKLLGFVREVQMAAVLGISLIADAFRAAISAVVIPVHVFTSELLPAVLIPAVRDWRKEGRAAAMFTSVLVVLAVFGLTLGGLVFVFAERWIALLVPGFTPEAEAQTVAFVRVMALGIPTYLVTSVLLCAEVALGRSRVGALQQIVLNTSVIVGVGVFALTGEPIVIAWCFAVAFFLLASYGVAYLHGLGAVAATVDLRAGLVATGRLIRSGGWLFLYPVVINVTLVLERVVASGLGTGSVAALDYARALAATSLFVIARPVGLVVLAQDYADEPAKARAHFDRLTLFTLAFGIPGAFFLTFLAGDLVTLIYERGAFQAEANRATTAVLFGFGCGFWASVLSILVIRMLSAAGRNNAATLAVGIGYGAQILALLGLTPVFGLMGLGLAEAVRSATMLLAAAWLLGFVPDLGRRLVQMLPLAALAWAVVVLAGTFETSWQRVLVAAALLGVATVGYPLAAFAEARRLARRLVDRLRRRGGAAIS